jgi:hypothetical protein
VPASTGSSPEQRAAAPSHETRAADRKWALSFLLGGTINPVSLAVLTVQGSRRFGRLELGLGIEGAIGHGDVIAQDIGTNSEQGSEALIQSAFSAPGKSYQTPMTITGFTLPVSLDIAVLRRQQWYLQVGAVGGYRMMGVLHQALGRVHASGSQGDAFVALRLTAGLALREGSALLLRGTWDIAPRTYDVPADELYTIAAFTTLQLGYAMGF